MEPDIHPDAEIDPTAQIGQNVRIERGVCIGREVTIGDRCRIRRNSIIGPYTALGPDNQVGPMAVVGGEPQDRKFEPDTISRTEVGAGNIIREFATIHRATNPGGVTRVGDRNFLFTGAHVAHECTVGSDCVLANHVAMGGHSRLGDRVFLSANALIHQYCWIGSLVIIQGNGATTMHLPPYVMAAGMNEVVGINLVGLRRAEHIEPEDIAEIREAYRILYRRGWPTPKALAEMDRRDWRPAASALREFVRDALSAEKPYNRGVTASRARTRNAGR